MKNLWKEFMFDWNRADWEFRLMVKILSFLCIVNVMLGVVMKSTPGLG